MTSLPPVEVAPPGLDAPPVGDPPTAVLPPTVPPVAGVPPITQAPPSPVLPPLPGPPPAPPVPPEQAPSRQAPVLQGVPFDLAVSTQAPVVWSQAEEAMHSPLGVHTLAGPGTHAPEDPHTSFSVQGFASEHEIPPVGACWHPPWISQLSAVHGL